MIGSERREAVGVRAATEADIAEMHRIRLEVRENRLGDPRLVQPRDYVELLTRRGRGWVAERGGCVMGFAVADRVECSVWALFVDPAREGRGVGRALHDAMLDWLFSDGAERVWLSTDPGTRAESLYRAAGWREVGRRENGEVCFEMARGDWRREVRTG
jgi:GNAT superfamily N-acetyltransferase